MNSILKSNLTSYQKGVLQLRMLRLRGFNLGQYHHHHRGQIQVNQSTCNLQIRLRKPPIFARTATLMAENKPTTPEENIEKEKEKVPPPAKKKELPTPPEKPEAGDCCGSGCVRCVWDVYYEELEAYDQIFKDFNNTPD